MRKIIIFISVFVLLLLSSKLITSKASAVDNFNVTYVYTISHPTASGNYDFYFDQTLTNNIGTLTDCKVYDLDQNPNTTIVNTYTTVGDMSECKAFGLADQYFNDHFIIKVLDRGGTEMYESNVFVWSDLPTASPTTPTPTPTDSPTPMPTTTPTPLPRELTSLSPAKVWIGKALGDALLKLDVQVEAYQDSALISSGQVSSVTVGSATFGNATLLTIPFTSFSPTSFPTGATLKIKVSARNACNGSFRNNGTARLWFNDIQANSSFDATIATVNQAYYLRDSFILATTAGTGPKKTIDVAAGAKCSSFKSFGTWTVTP